MPPHAWRSDSLSPTYQLVPLSNRRMPANRLFVDAISIKQNAYLGPMSPKRQDQGLYRDHALRNRARTRPDPAVWMVATIRHSGRVRRSVRTGLLCGVAKAE